MFWPLLGALISWQLGAHFDAWYHVHYGARIESFFTWPHAMLYAGWAITAALAVVQLARVRSQRSVARGGLYVVGLGVGIFALGGPVDFLWHAVVGFEASIETVFSPSHLWLLIGFMIATLGMLVTALQRRGRAAVDAGPTRAAELAVMLCVASLFRATLWPLFYAAPLAVDYAASGATVRGLPAYVRIDWGSLSAAAAGSTGMLLYSVVLALFVVLVVHRLALPTGSVALLMLWDALLIAAVTGMWLYVPAVAGAALVGEVLLAFARRSSTAVVDPVWVLAPLVVVTEFLGYYLLMSVVGGGIRWSPPLWVGTVGVAGLFALIGSVLAAPPRSLSSR